MGVPPGLKSSALGFRLVTVIALWIYTFTPTLPLSFSVLVPKIGSGVAKSSTAAELYISYVTQVATFISTSVALIAAFISTLCVSVV